MSKTKWSEILEANSDKIIAAMVQAKRKAHHSMSGWHVDVEMDKSGEVWTGGLASCGSQSMSSWNGETFVIASIGTWVTEINEQDWIDNVPELNEEYEAQMEDEDGFEYAWEFMQEKHPETWSEWKNEGLENEIEMYEEQASYNLDEIIAQQKQREDCVYE
jgi:hypothetical protein